MYDYYFLFIGLILLCALFAGWASAKVHSTFNAYQEVPTSSRMTGYDTAVRLLRANGIRHIRIGRVQGMLTDHFHPTQNIVNLSDSTYSNDSVTAVAVSAHEIGHVLQKEQGYFPYKIRTVLVPITNIGSRLALPLVFIGLLFDIFLGIAQNSDIGFTLAMIGVAMYGLSTLFAFVTLPVELDASRRAKNMLVSEGIITTAELPYAEKMLSAAARTYLASLLTSLVYFLRFLVWVLVMFGKNDRD